MALPFANVHGRDNRNDDGFRFDRVLKSWHKLPCSLPQACTRNGTQSQPFMLTFPSSLSDGLQSTKPERGFLLTFVEIRRYRIPSPLDFAIATPSY